MLEELCTHSSLLTTTDRIFERALAEGVIKLKCVKPDFRVSIQNLCSQELSPVAVCFWGRLRRILLLKYAKAAALGLHLFRRVTFTKGCVQQRHPQLPGWQSP